MMFSATDIFELICLFLVDVLILVGNSLVILAYISGPRALRTCTNYFVINLAVSDLLVGFISLPFWICVRLGLTDTENPSFNYLMSLDILFGTTSILCLSAISLERMYAVRYPVEHHNLKHKPVYCVIAGTWVFGVLITFIKFAIPVENRDRVYSVLILVLDFFVPLMVIIGCYAVIFQTARTMMVVTSQKRNISMEMRVTKTISVIIGLFVFSWSPFFILNMVYYFCNPDEHYCRYLNYGGNSWPIDATKALHYSNSMMNFLVYAVRSPDFRRTFKLLLLKRCNHTVIRLRFRTLSNSKKKNLLAKDSAITRNRGGVSKLLTPQNGGGVPTLLTPTSVDNSTTATVTECAPSNDVED